MRGLPDVIGMPVDEAVKICRSKGFKVEITTTGPAGANPGKKSRVVRFKAFREIMVLTVVNENNYERRWI